MECNHLFVYGLLMEGFEYEVNRLIRENCTLIGSATVIGRLYEVGGYPGLILDSSGYQIKGSLLRIDSNHQFLMEKLDEFEAVHGLESDEYVRVQIEVDFDNSPQQAWVYQYRLPVGGQEEILCGDFKQHLRETNKQAWRGEGFQ